MLSLARHSSSPLPEGEGLGVREALGSCLNLAWNDYISTRSEKKKPNLHRLPDWAARDPASGDLGKVCPAWEGQSYAHRYANKQRLALNR